MHIRRDRDGGVWVVGMPAFVADTLRRLPEWIASADPAVRERLLPPAYRDERAEREWERLARPELEHLFKSRGEILRQDLVGLKKGVLGGAMLRIPEPHVSAWLSALNAGRHALFILHEVDPGDVGRDLRQVEEPTKAEALLRMEVLGWVQQLLIDGGGE
jgi:hypothetical protein